MVNKGNSSHRTPTTSGERRKEGIEIQIETDSDLEWDLASTQGLDYAAPQRGASGKPCSQRY